MSGTSVRSTETGLGGEDNKKTKQKRTKAETENKVDVYVGGGMPVVCVLITHTVTITQQH